MRIFSGNFGRPAILAFASWMLAIALSVPGSMACAQDERPVGGSAPSNAMYVALEHRSPGQMSESDAALVQARHQQIVDEAAFFGYFLNLGGWTFDQTLCPDIPGAVVLHYRKQSPGGAVSLFTALVPRSEGRVLIVPIVYKNAMPYRSAIGAARTIEVFNRSVPAEVALKSARPGGDWLSLGMTYAAIAGAEPIVPRQPDTVPALTKAPVPTVQLSAANRVREIIFADRDSADQFAVWTVDLDKTGRATAASLAVYPNARIREVPERAAMHETPIPPAPPLKMKLIPPGPTPTEKPISTN